MSTFIDTNVKALHITYYYESEHRIVFQFKMTILNKLSTFLAFSYLLTIYAILTLYQHSLSFSINKRYINRKYPNIDFIYEKNIGQATKKYFCIAVN